MKFSADLEPLSWTGGGVPLYMRGANTAHTDQEDDQLNKAIDLLQERLFTLSCEEEVDSQAEASEETSTQTYAGVLRREGGRKRGRESRRERGRISGR